MLGISIDLLQWFRPVKLHTHPVSTIYHHTGVSQFKSFVSSHLTKYSTLSGLILYNITNQSTNVTISFFFYYSLSFTSSNHLSFNFTQPHSINDLSTFYLILSRFSDLWTHKFQNFKQNWIFSLFLFIKCHARKQLLWQLL